MTNKQTNKWSISKTGRPLNLSFPNFALIVTFFFEMMKLKPKICGCKWKNSCFLKPSFFGFSGADYTTSVLQWNLWSVICRLACVRLLWLVCCKISKSNFDQSDAIQCRNPCTCVKLQDNLMSCMLKWSKSLYFCVIWKNLLNGSLARGRNTFSLVRNCILNISKTESTFYLDSLEVARPEKSSLAYFWVVFTTTVCH